MVAEDQTREGGCLNPHPFRSLKRLFYGYVLVQTLLMILPMMAMPTLHAAALVWCISFLTGVLAIPSFAAFVICNSTKPPLGGEIFVWTVYILLILGAVLPANRIWRRCSAIGLLLMVLLAVLAYMCVMR